MTRKKVRLDSVRLQDERTARNSRAGKFTQPDMAELLDIGLSTYQKAEAGECIETKIAEKIRSKLGLDAADLGITPCDPPAVDTRAYLASIHTDTAFIDIRGLLVGSGKAPRLPIDKVYIPLKSAGGGEHRLDGKGEPKSAPTLEKTIDTHRRLVIVGDPGGGKSTFLRRLAHRHSGSDRTLFPIPIRIFALEDFMFKRLERGVAGIPAPDSAEWFPLFLEDCSKQLDWGLNADFFRAKLREPSTVILLDGLDEVPNTARRERIARLFERAIAAYREARFVVTTRPVSYEGKGTLDGFEAIRIGELDTEAVEGFLRDWSAFLFPDDRKGANEHTQALLLARRTRPEIRRMTVNPLMLTALAVIQWNDRKLPEQRADLFESILKWLSEAHDRAQPRQGSDCLSLFGVLALYMQAREGGRVKQIEKAEAARAIKDEFRDVADDRREAAALEFLEGELLDSGIVVQRGDSLEFWHLTFQEYLAARASNDLDVVDVLFSADRWLQNEWRETVLLTTGVLIRNGRLRVDSIFKAAIERAEGESGSNALAVRARAAGLLGTALLDLSPRRYRPPDEAKYEALLNETLALFSKDRRVAEIDIKVRCEAAEALGQAGDPRLREDNPDRWVALEGGTFLMGAQNKSKKKAGYDEQAFDDEGPPRDVPVERFQIGRYPVTVEEFRRFVDDDESGYAEERVVEDWDEQLSVPNCPVVNVNWHAAVAYCNWATKRDPGGATIRLPREDEWEFAARGVTSRRYPWGSDDPTPNHANYHETSLSKVSPVGLFPSGNTPEGIADLAGNVWEWTGSDYNEQAKVVRGACFDDDRRDLRASNRDRFVPETRNSDPGFRVVRELKFP